MNNLFVILHEDADLLVINKPAGLVCHPTKGDAFSSLISRVRLYLNVAPASGPAPAAAQPSTLNPVKGCGRVAQLYAALCPQLSTCFHA